MVVSVEGALSQGGGDCHMGWYEGRCTSLGSHGRGSEHAGRGCWLAAAIN